MMINQSLLFMHLWKQSFDTGW